MATQRVEGANCALAVRHPDVHVQCGLGRTADDPAHLVGDALVPLGWHELGVAEPRRRMHSARQERGAGAERRGSPLGKGRHGVCRVLRRR